VAARAAAVSASAVLASPSAARAPARRIGGARRRRTPMTLDTKLRVIGWHAAGRTIDYISRQLDNQYDRSGLYKIIKQKDSLLSRAAEGAAGGRVSSRAGQYPKVDKALLEWFLAVCARGRKRVPLSLAILRQKALQVAEHLCITDFAASNGFIQRWASRHGLVNVALHGSGASANVEEAAERMAAIRQQHEGVDVDLIYNVDETGLLYRGLPSRSYVPSEDRRTARGSKAMKRKDRVTVTLCCNATGTRKVPVTMIGKAAQPMCFQGEGNASPLPYFSQKPAWTDASVFKRWFEEVFVPAVQARTAHHVYLIMDNLGCHRRRFCPRACLVTSVYFKSPTAWCSRGMCDCKLEKDCREIGAPQTTAPSTISRQRQWASAVCGQVPASWATFRPIWDQSEHTVLGGPARALFWLLRGDSC